MRNYLNNLLWLGAGMLLSLVVLAPLSGYSSS
jgi:hypothetical protein